MKTTGKLKLAGALLGAAIITATTAFAGNNGSGMDPCGGS